MADDPEPTFLEQAVSDSPVAAFYFSVRIGLGLTDTSFQEVQGLDIEFETEDVREGGENRYTHTLPLRAKHPLLELKRGIAPVWSPLVIWCRETLELGLNAPIQPLPVNVLLMNELGTPVRVWTLMNAYPVSWQVEAFGATKNELALENIRLNYNYSSRML